MVQVARVVDVLVGQENPTHIVRFDEREHVVQPCLAVGRCAGIDDDWLAAEDHHRIEVDEQTLPEGGLHLVDHEGVGGDPGRRHVHGRRYRGKGHRDPR